jgi:hypothetical protein
MAEIMKWPQGGEGLKKIRFLLLNNLLIRPNNR